MKHSSQTEVRAENRYITCHDAESLSRALCLALSLLSKEQHRTFLTCLPRTLKQGLPFDFSNLAKQRA